MSEPSLDISLVILATGDTPDLTLFREMLEVYRVELESSGRSHEVLVVDDGIGGAFLQAAKDAQKTWPAVRVIGFRRPFGESVALDTAVANLRGRYVVTSTWYLQVDPAGLRAAVERLDAGMDFIAVRRHPRVDGAFAQLNSWLFNAYTRWLTKSQVHDLNCSFRAFRREVVEELSFHGDLFRFISILAEQKGFRVEEIPVKHLNEFGRSTFLQPGLYLRRFLDILSLFFLIKFTRKPLRFFGLVGIGFFLTGGAISLWLLYLRLFDGQGLAERPMLILGIFLVVLGIIVSSIGLIGEIIIFTQGRNLRDYHVDTIVEGGQEQSATEDPS